MRNEPLHSILATPAGDAAAASSQTRWDEACRAVDFIGHVSWSSETRLMEGCANARRMMDLPASGAFDLSVIVTKVRHRHVEAVVASWHEALVARTRRIHLDVPLVLSDRTAMHLRVVAVLDYAADGSVLACDAILQDITEAQRLGDRLSDAERRLDEAQEIAGFGHWEWDFTQRRAKYSAKARHILGLDADHTPDIHQLGSIIPPGQREVIAEAFTTALRERQQNFRYTYHLPGADGARRDFHGVVKAIYGRSGSPQRLLGTIQDVTELNTYRERLHSLSYFDPLTQLPNRALLVERTRRAISDANRDERVFGVLMLDLDQFKHVNESLGHASGDELLKQAAARLLKSLREQDTVARIGGDEFAVLLPSVRAPADLDRIATKLLRAFEAPFRLLNRDVFVTTSVGAAMYPHDGDAPDALLQHADAALSQAKSVGRNNVKFYSPQLTAQASARLLLETELRQAIEQHQLVLHYQPKFDLATRRLTGAEALMRWNHPERGLVPPLSFIPVAEETGLIVAMGAWALQETCRVAVQWNTGKHEPLRFAVNLSARQFVGGNLVETVCAAMDQTRCQPEWLELEITESLLIDNRSSVRDDLETLASLGISIALDDFGTGYSALSYLTQFPVHTLKIDRSFVKDLPGDRKSGALARAIVSLGRSLQMTLVAEGVETEAQAQMLGEMGCDSAQGYLLGKPLPESAFGALVDAAAGAAA